MNATSPAGSAFTQRRCSAEPGPRTLAIGVVLVCALASPAGAQWLHVPQAGTPRAADGKPDLTAPAPRTSAGTPDLSGIWQRPRGVPPGSGGPDGIAAGVEVLFQPWAEAVYKARGENNGKGTPSERCLPHGITKAVSVPEPFKIVQTPGLVLILHEEFNHHRQIFTDGRRTSQRRAPTWFGYSRGTWDGDTFVVDTTGFVNDTWLDFRGHPATDALHLVERYRRSDFGHLEIQFTIDDPKAYRRPWNVTMTFGLLPDTELIEHICENERDAAQIVGR
jgi:hypothetical protein